MAPRQANAQLEEYRKCAHCGRPVPVWRQVHVCRTCPSYSKVWAGDVRVKLFAAMNAYADWYSQISDVCKIRMLTVTGPGVDGGLPWDEEHCWHLGEHTHTGRLGCRALPAAAALFNENAPAWWSELHRQARQCAERTGSTAPELLARIWEEQKRGVLHVHLVVGYTTPAEREAADRYAWQLERLSERHGFGFVDTHMQVREPTSAAAYLSSYFVTGKGGKVSLRESVQSSAMPPSIIYVAPWLSKRSGITMRSLRLRRYAWQLWRSSTDLQRLVDVRDLWWGLCEGWSLAKIADEFF